MRLFISMIKLKRLIKELSGGDLQETDLNDIQSLITQTFAKKYPKAKLYFEQETHIYVSTDKENPSAASMWGEGSHKHYYFAFNLYAEGETLNLVVGNATANNYKGVTGDLVKALFDFGSKKYSPITQKILFIEDDRSGGVWEKMAQKLGAEYQSN